MAQAQAKDTGDNGNKSNTEKMDFGADVSRLLNIVANALYSNRDVFLRELISNAADACDRLRYEAIQNPDLTKKDPELKIHLFKDAPARKLTVMDNGIGMTKDELVENLGTIAKSGTAALMEQMKDATSKDDKLSLIGQFGVGFYATFMVSDHVQVISRKASEKKTWLWESDGSTGFTVREATKDETKRLEPAQRGTAIIAHIDDDSSEFLIDQKLEEVVKIWSDHITVPIYLGEPAKGEDDKPEKINNASALWMRPKSEITDEEYTQFYKHITHGFDEPLMTSHWRAEGKIEYTALLYVPTMRPWDLYDPTRKASTRLYVKRVMITEDCEGLMYPWLRFVRGVVDSEDLPLNISREMLQHNPIIEKIKRGVAKRILGDLDKLAQNDPGQYAIFWGQFGATLKEGLYDAFEHKDELLKIVRFYSTHADNELTSLEDYVSRMNDDQDEIYYISGENLDTLKNSPQIEGFKARGIEVLFFTDTIDDFWLQNQTDYKGKKFKSVTKGGIDLDRFDKEKSEEKEDDKEVDVDANLEKLIAAIKDNLDEEVGEVRLTNRLTDSPVCLIADDNEVDLRMERVLRIHQQYEAPTKRILEVNGKHPLITKLASYAEAESAKGDMSDAAHLLMDQARIIQGEPVPDPASFARRMSKFMERGLVAAD